MVGSAVWVRNLRLTPNDPVFDGGEADPTCTNVQDGNAWANSADGSGSLSQHSLLTAEPAARGCAAHSAPATMGLDQCGPAGQAVLTAATLTDIAMALRAFAPLLNLG